MSHKALLLSTLLVFALLLGALITTQLVSPPYPRVSRDYTEKKAVLLTKQYGDDATQSSDTVIYAVAEELPLYLENARQTARQGYVCMLRSVDRDGAITSIRSDGEVLTEGMGDTAAASAVLAGAKEEMDTFSEITSNAQYGIPDDGGGIKVYLTTSNGVYLRVYTPDEYAASPLPALINTLFK